MLKVASNHENIVDYFECAFAPFLFLCNIRNICQDGKWFLGNKWKNLNKKNWKLVLYLHKKSYYWISGASAYSWDVQEDGGAPCATWLLFSAPRAALHSILITHFRCSPPPLPIICVYAIIKVILNSCRRFIFVHMCISKCSNHSKGCQTKI